MVFSRGQDKKDLALSLGGHYYFDTNTDDIVAETAVGYFFTFHFSLLLSNILF